jgi:hypothetical protein
MKMNYKPFLFVLAIVAAAFAWSAWGNGASMVAERDPMAVGQLYRYNWTNLAGDTLTDTEADTLYLPVNLLSNWTYNYSIVKTELTGTLAVDLALQESARATGTTDWITIASTSAAQDTLEAPATLQGANVYGVRHRLILTGSGTQTALYNIQAVLKKTN